MQWTWPAWSNRSAGVRAADAALACQWRQRQQQQQTLGGRAASELSQCCSCACGLHCARVAVAGVQQRSGSDVWQALQAVAATQPQPLVGTLLVTRPLGQRRRVQHDWPLQTGRTATRTPWWPRIPCTGCAPGPQVCTLRHSQGICSKTLAPGWDGALHVGNAWRAHARAGARANMWDGSDHARPPHSPVMAALMSASSYA